MIENNKWYLHPHHLIYYQLHIFLWNLLKECGLAIRSLPLMQAVSLLFSCLTLFLFYRLSIIACGATAVISKKFLLSFSATLILAFSNAFWHFSTEAEYIIPSLPFLIWIGIELFKDQDRKPSGVFIGFLLLMAILINQPNVLFAVVLLLYTMFARKLSWKTTILALSIAGFGSILLYGLVFVKLGLQDWHSIYRWLTLYFHAFFPGSIQSSDYLLGFSNSLIAITRGLFWFKIIGFGLFAGLILGAFPYLWKLSKVIDKSLVSEFEKKQNMALFFLLWMVVFLVPICRWEPIHYKFWIPVIPPLILLTIVIPPIKKISYLGIIILVPIFFITNLICHAIPSADLKNDNDYQYAQEIFKVCGENGYVIAPFDYYAGDGCLRYFFHFQNVIENGFWVPLLYSDPLKAVKALEEKTRQGRVLVTWKPELEPMQWLLKRISNPETKEQVSKVLENLYIEEIPILSLDLQNRDLFIHRTQRTSIKVDFYLLKNRSGAESISN